MVHRQHGLILVRPKLLSQADKMQPGPESYDLTACLIGLQVTNLTWQLRHVVIFLAFWEFLTDTPTAETHVFTHLPNLTSHGQAEL